MKIEILLLYLFIYLFIYLFNTGCKKGTRNRLWNCDDGCGDDAFRQFGCGYGCGSCDWNHGCGDGAFRRTGSGQLRQLQTWADRRLVGHYQEEEEEEEEELQPQRQGEQQRQRELQQQRLRDPCSGFLLFLKQSLQGARLGRQRHHRVGRGRVCGFSLKRSWLPYRSSRVWQRKLCSQQSIFSKVQLKMAFKGMDG